ncbi:MAG: hypothetical protein R3A44_43135 [Caldilineaceae bacterium]
MNRKSKNSASSNRLNLSQQNNIISGGTVADMFMLSSDLRPEWRGFSLALTGLDIIMTLAARCHFARRGR